TPDHEPALGGFGSQGHQTPAGGGHRGDDICFGDDLAEWLPGTAVRGPPTTQTPLVERAEVGGLGGEEIYPPLMIEECHGLAVVEDHGRFPVQRLPPSHLAD